MAEKQSNELLTFSLLRLNHKLLLLLLLLWLIIIKHVSITSQFYKKQADKENGQ